MHRYSLHSLKLKATLTLYFRKVLYTYILVVYCALKGNNIDVRTFFTL